MRRRTGTEYGCTRGARDRGCGRQQGTQILERRPKSGGSKNDAQVRERGNTPESKAKRGKKPQKTARDQSSSLRESSHKFEKEEERQKYNEEEKVEPSKGAGITGNKKKYFS